MNGLNIINNNSWLCNKARILAARAMSIRTEYSIESTGMVSRILRLVVLLCLIPSMPAMAESGVIADTGGEVNIIPSDTKLPHLAKKNDILNSGVVVNTGDNSYAVLRFEDGQVATLQSNSSLKVREYRFFPSQIKRSSIIFSGFKGGMRFITGLIGQRNHKAFRLLTPNATIGVRGTEFLMVLDKGVLYGKVVRGAVSMTNTAGMALIKEGQAVMVVSSKKLPKAIPASALPTGIFDQLDNIDRLTADTASQPVISGDASLGGGAITQAGGVMAGGSASLLGTAAAVGRAQVLSGSVGGAAILPPSLSAGAPGLPSQAPQTVVASSPKTVSNQQAETKTIVPNQQVEAKTLTIVTATPARRMEAASPPSKYVGAELLCDFCTGRTDTKPAHIQDPEGSPAHGDQTMFGKHNLTTVGDATGEICAFCHTPQGAENTVEGPRWNRTASTLIDYRAYSSLGSATQEATGSISLACLGCHDGTQAPNIVANNPAIKLNTDKEVDPRAKWEISRHHPVGVLYAGGGATQASPDVPLNPEQAFGRLAVFNQFAQGNRFSPQIMNRTGFYNTADRAAFSDIGNFSNEGDFGKERFNRPQHSGTGNGTVWWVRSPNSKTKKGRQKTDLYLFTRADTIEDAPPGESVYDRPYVECATCHDPHSTNSTFLRMPGGNGRSQICLTCHNK